VSTMTPVTPMTDRVVRERIEANMALVDQIVYQAAAHFPRHVDREELARAGALGLIEAAHRYDEHRGVPFPRFAARRIRGAILDFVRSADWAPRTLRSAGRELEMARTALTARIGRMPTDHELASEMGITLRSLAALQGRIARTVVLALDEHVAQGEDGDLTLVDTLCDASALDPSEELEGRELRSYLRDAIALLPERHRCVVVGYFFEGKTSDAIARFLGVTESRVSQMRTEAMQMLKEGISAQYAEAPVAAAPVRGRIARRQADYVAAIASRRDYKARLANAEILDLAPHPVGVC